MNAVRRRLHPAAGSMRWLIWVSTLPSLCTAASLAYGGQIRVGDSRGGAMPAATHEPMDSASEDCWNAAASLQLDEPPNPLNVSIAPYAWLTSQSGNLTVRGITLDADVSFSDLLDKSDSLFALVGAVDVQYDRLVLQFNASYARVEFSGSRSEFRHVTLSAAIKETLGWYEFFGGYRLLDESLDQDGASSGRLTLDGFVGGRVTAIEADATLSASTNVTLPDGEVLKVGMTREWGGSKDWFEPFVGARLGLDLSDHWSLSLRGDVGGFGISGAEFAWSGAALVGYHWTMDGWTLTAFGGYRVLGQDFSSGDFGWDVTTYGPILGAQFSFSF